MASQQIQSVDLIIRGGSAITVDAERRVIRDAGIAIKGENIEFVGKAAEVDQRFRASKVIDAKGKVLTPGFVNAHVHYSHHVSKGLIPDSLGPSVS